MFSSDCAAPPDDDPATVDCVDGRCALLCPLGLGDCNRKASDGCEVNLNTDLQHCGECGAVCDPANAVQGKCQSGVCLIDFENGGCVDPFDDCDNDPVNGCEVNLNTSAAHCGSCGAACSSANGARSCAAGNCAITCNDGYANCDGDARSNGCEINTNADTKHCGECDDACPTGASNQSPFCVSASCGLTTCAAGLGDCDGNGTCTDSLTSITNCGACGNSCSAANGTATCMNPGSGYQCRIGACTTGGGKEWKDCDGNYFNGCEVDVQSSVNRCGGCLPGDSNAGSGVDCNALRNNASLNISAITCTAGGCRITGCNGSYADCDGNPANGCEVDTSSSTGRCGGCLPTDANPGAGAGVNCSALWPNANAICSGSVCQFTTCHTNYGNCANGLTDGCESDLRSTTAHCGACNLACTQPTGTSSNTCSASSCMPTCASPSSQWENCDANGANGCENKLTNASHCGACGTVCQTNGGTSANVCSSGTCSPTCATNFLSCDGNPNNGCEVNRMTNASHCGACGTACQTNVGTSSNVCSSGTCSPTCATNYLNCDSNPVNGCEVNRTNNVNHCGACNRRCGGAAQTNVNTASCSSSTCNVTCTGGLCPDASDPERKCTASLGTTQNCTSCGQVCSGATPFCDPGTGCKATKTIRIAARQAGQRNTVSGTTATATVSRTGSEVGHRVLAVSVMALNPGQSRPTSVTYGGQALTEAGFIQAGGENRSYAGIWLLTECGVAAASGSTVTVTMPTADWGSVAFEAVLFENVEQSPLTAVTNSAGNALSIQLSGVSVVNDSWFFGAASHFQYPLNVSAPSAGAGTSTAHTGESHGSTSTTFGALSAASYNFGWTSSDGNGWGEKVAAGVTLRPASTPAGTCP